MVWAGIISINSCHGKLSVGQSSGLVGRDERDMQRDEAQIEKDRLSDEEIKKLNGEITRLNSNQMVSQRLIEEQRREILADQDWAERLSHQVMSYRGVPVLFKPDLIGGESVELPPGVAP